MSKVTSIHFLGVILLFIFSACNAQNKPTETTAKSAVSLENRIFKIDSYINGKKENSEDLTFQNALLKGSECVKYGFEPSAFTTTQNGENLTFNCTMLSAKEGKMVWEGKVIGHSLEGKVVWSKTGQTDMTMTYNGQEKQ
jgi:hypothetical protein